MSSSARHHVPMQHVLLGPQWPTRWYVSDLWGHQTWMLLPTAPRHWRTVGAIVSPAAWPASSLLLLLQEKERVLVITTSFLIWAPWLHVFPLLPWLLIVFPTCLLCLRLLPVQDGKDIRETKSLMLCCFELWHSNRPTRAKWSISDKTCVLLPLNTACWRHF